MVSNNISQRNISVKDTKGKAYKELLVAKESWWKQALDVQLSYRFNLHKLELGKVLDIGCGIGRNLRNLSILGNQAVGVDHNEFSVNEARDRGYQAFVTDEFMEKYKSSSGIFDSLLISHVIEHMSVAEATALIKVYLQFLTQNGKIVIITPQEKGFAADPTHIKFMDFASLASILRSTDCVPEKAYSFPFPRFFGKFFTYNEFVAVGRKT
jgi:2-polyprenyl-3-methyl-5-hydroxy-6-metoxy-1,4-benzoquinol methylase